MTYNVFGGTLNFTQSVSLCVCNTITFRVLGSSFLHIRYIYKEQRSGSGSDSVAELWRIVIWLFVQRLIMGSTTVKALRYGRCVTRRSHSFTCHQHTNHTFLEKRWTMCMSVGGDCLEKWQNMMCISCVRLRTF